MIKHISIYSFKSIEAESVDVGNFNVIIGANGCGKSNLLESLCFISAAAFNKTDNEYLSNRGVRITTPDLMKSRFDKSSDLEISFGVIDENNKDYKFLIKHDGNPYSNWKTDIDNVDNIILKLLNSLQEKSTKHMQKLDAFIESGDLYSESNGFDNPSIKVELAALEQTHRTMKTILDKRDSIKESIKNDFKIFEPIESIKDFIIYTPENSTLRNLTKQTNVTPLGQNGDGLFNLLAYTKKNSPEKFKEIIDYLSVFVWFESFEISGTEDDEEETLKVKDKFIDLNLDQRCVNEGFLFVLFYLTVVISDQTPNSFAIDNIDTSLNPKLCTKLISDLSKLAVKYNKQIFVTTHNPAVLDGLDLTAESNKLIICSRKKNGKSQFKSFNRDDRPKTKDGNYMKMSEAFMRGFIGGLPKEF